MTPVAEERMWTEMVLSYNWNLDFVCFCHIKDIYNSWENSFLKFAVSKPALV